MAGFFCIGFFALLQESLCPKWRVCKGRKEKKWKDKNPVEVVSLDVLIQEQGK